MRKRELHSLPNLFTAANLCSGAVAVFSLITRIDYLIPFCIVFSLFCDFLDGWIARKMGIQSPIGKELDSLADVISFGLVPSFMMMRMFNLDFQFEGTVKGVLLFILPLTIAIYSSFRLAKFNLETRDSEYFYGLNTPSNTLMILGVFMSWQNNQFELPDLLNHNLWILIPVLVSINWLLISNTPMFSNKSIKKQFKGNLPFLIIGVIGVLSILLLGHIGISVTIITHVLLSLLSLRLKVFRF